MPNSYLVTPEERDELRKLARYWPRDRARRLRIARFNVETVDSCPRCGGPVRRCDARIIASRDGDQTRIGHLYCITGRGDPPPDDLEPL